MAELFRFIQQAFVVSGDTASIDLTSQSAFQNGLRDLIHSGAPYTAVRTKAEQYLDTVINGPSSSPGVTSAALADPGLARRAKYVDLRAKLLALPCPPQPTPAQVDAAIKGVFGQSAADLVASQQFPTERDVSGDVLVAVKLTTRFDLIDAPSITTMRQVIAFVADFAAGHVTPLTIDHIRALLDRPVRIPKVFLPTPTPAAAQAAPAARDESAARRDLLLAEQDSLRGAYDTLLTVRPDRLAISVPAAQRAEAAAPNDQAPTANRTAAAAPSVLTVAPEIVASMDEVVRERLRTELGDTATASFADILAVIKGRWLAVSREVEPNKVPTPLRTYRLGANVFAVQESLAADAAPPPPDFSHAITRPVGVGDLQVVRQELIGYVAADISHIENVLPGELLKKTTKREETSELIVTQETETTQTDERDTQTTDRNELVSETQKEASQQSTATSDQTSTTSYGRLVENSKTDYARSVTDRAVKSLTQQVKQQRVQREKKVYTEEAEHQLDNSKGLRPIRGIYQWVDKKYKTRVLNYGKRLLYDVVLPEPASFLIESLKTAAQPENYQLVRPVEPTVQPGDLNASNYMIWAAQYGVTGSVTPPPDEITTVVAHAESGDVARKLQAYGGSFDAEQFGQFTIRVPNDYSAISGYLQRTNPNEVIDNTQTENRIFEFFIGENTFIRQNENDQLNKSFAMNGETGDIPVTFNTFRKMLQYNFAIGITCRIDRPKIEEWQLKTHAQIVQGYQRQRADYLDQLSRFQAAVRAQMALAQGLAHDATAERDELKKAFIQLLMSEHFGQVYFPTPDPGAFPPDPRYVKTWGAVVAFFERAFEWEHLMYLYYPYFWGRRARWGELVLIQDVDPQFESFLKAGAARVVIPVRPGFEAALAHFHETGDVWMGEEIPDMFSDQYVSIIAEIKARNFAEDAEVCVDQWEVRLPTTLVMLKDDADLPEWTPTPCRPGADTESR
ncbi:hypothetical protein [Nocardia arthritidis]|uniref:Uncharacterized protein n=1 Tax=Nocardia arthritidis TaxID=228602 RepID=A0A6G9YMT8_9NOCA|nr:hypothetical protein [Nocardia arthritidis]QIS14524.1 hypothetical protein F5544_33440 [Nocardia arthritidis]